MTTQSSYVQRSTVFDEEACEGADSVENEFVLVDQCAARETGRRLKDACLSGSVAALEALIDEDELILNRVSSLIGFFINDSTPLHVAALRGHLDFAKALLTRKPELATKLDSSWSSPLHLACIKGHFEIVEELLWVNTNAKPLDSSVSGVKRKSEAPITEFVNTEAPLTRKEAQSEGKGNSRNQPLNKNADNSEAMVEEAECSNEQEMNSFFVRLNVQLPLNKK
ncbi:hypothetical protein RHSIM_Rhsim02G0230600 [Rhododendron simsii]|uniref:Uncharacterized protein n=1 Tax=Rhododendron simsii TaxID=118357 RepID=A0A834HFH3_RHOSS|nr:hypothetical protein RHSIM_Rhsim02G0230600 [Rhododendron simsii]